MDGYQFIIAIVKYCQFAGRGHDKGKAIEKVSCFSKSYVSMVTGFIIKFADKGSSVFTSHHILF